MKAGAASCRVAIVACLVALAGCSRQPPRFVPPNADSSLAVKPDSFAVLVGMALEQWESEGGSPAAQATARLLLDDLRRHTDGPLADRARTFLDSCGFSAEVSGGADVVAINLFSRSDPTGGAWPNLFWREGESVRQQALEGGGMRLFDVAVRGADEGGDVSGGDLSQVSAIFGRASSRGQQPVVIAWRRSTGSGRWALSQTLGPDSLGGVGVAEFVPQGSGPPVLEARTYRRTPGFDECATCPHIHHTLRFMWTRSGWSKTGEETAASPYGAFVQLIAALSVGDREMALRLVADPSLLEAADRFELGRPKALWRVAPGTDESAEEMTFFRSGREAYKVRFAPREGQWMVTDLQPAQRSIE